MLQWSDPPHEHRRTEVPTPRRDHGPSARARRVSLGSRADLRVHQALHPRRDLRGPRRHRPPGLARTWPRSSAISSFRRFFYAQMASEHGLFDIENSLDAINSKLIRRHPHVFGDQSAETSGDVKRIWGEVKAAEKKEQGKTPETLLGGVPRALPALVEAQQIAASRGRRLRLGEPRAGHRQASRGARRVQRGAPQRRPIRAGRRAGRHALRDRQPGALRQGRPRAGAPAHECQVPAALRAHRAKIAEQGKTLEQATIDEMEALWQEAKR